jgi:hypothetical protein
VDAFFNCTPVITDWEWVYANLDKVRIADLIDTIKSMEPLKVGDQNEHVIWIQQQTLRLALRHNADLPLKGHTCPTCGKNLADPVLEQCLPCAEWERQMPYVGGRGSCSYFAPKYDVDSHTWGIIYYMGHHDTSLLTWVAKGFNSRTTAWLALYPLKLYGKWLERRYLGVGNFYSVYCEMVDVSYLVKNKDKIPFDPAAFEVYLRNSIAEHMQQNHDILSWTTRNAVRDYARQNNS